MEWALTSTDIDPIKICHPSLKDIYMRTENIPRSFLGSNKTLESYIEGKTVENVH